MRILLRQYKLSIALVILFASIFLALAGNTAYAQGLITGYGLIVAAGLCVGMIRELLHGRYGVDILAVDCLRREPHPTHAHLGMALELIEAVRAKQAVLTHLDKSMDYRTLCDEVPPHVRVGYDGLVIAP